MQLEQAPREARAKGHRAVRAGHDDGAVEALLELVLRLHAQRDGLLERGVFLLQVLLERADLEVRPHAREHLLRVEWLRDEVHRAGIEAAHLVHGVGQGGEEKDREVAPARVGLDAAAGLEAVKAGHEHVEQDDVRLGELQLREGTLAALGHEHLVAGVGEEVEQDAEIGRHVVHDEDGLHCDGRARRRRR